MRALLRTTNVYRAFLKGAAHFTLTVFPDEKYLRALLKECAKAFFGASDGSRTEKLIEAESFSDCIMLPPVGGKLTAEAAAGIADEAMLRPVEGEKKLFVLDMFHTAAPLVQNKLLKLLEEPPRGVYFLAGAVQADAVLPTVRSRANLYTVPPFAEEAVKQALLREHAGERGVEEAAAACGGVYSAAEALLSGGDLPLAARFLTEEHAEALCREIGAEKRPAFLPAVRLLLRDALLMRAGQGRFASSRGEAVRAVAARYPAGVLAAALGLVDEAEREVQFNANFAQALLALSLKISKENASWSTSSL